MHPTDHNGILGSVPGQSIAAAEKLLPPAEECTDSVRLVDFDAEVAGRVRIRFKRKHFRHGRSSHWAWVAVWAEKAAGP